MQSETIKEIKRSFRRYMNGTAAASMREKGLDYGVNWGISLPNLREIAAAYQQDAALAEALWGEKSRECRILATLLMPADGFNGGTAERWISQIGTNEMAEQLAFNLLSKVPFALPFSMKHIDSESLQAQLCAIQTLSRLLATRRSSPADIPSSVRLAIEKLQSSPDVAIAHAAFNCYSRIEFA